MTPPQDRLDEIQARLEQATPCGHGDPCPCRWELEQDLIYLLAERKPLLARLKAAEAVCEAAKKARDAFAALCRAVADDEHCQDILDRAEQQAKRGTGKQLDLALTTWHATKEDGK